MPKTLRLFHAAGQPHEIDGDVAAQFSGNSVEVLREIVQQRIHDPELLTTLGDPRVALEQFSETPDSTHEAPLSPNSNWADIVERLRETDVEIGIARSHEGGNVCCA